MYNSTVAHPVYYNMDHPSHIVVYQMVEGLQVYMFHTIVSVQDPVSSIGVVFLCNSRTFCRPGDLGRSHHVGVADWLVGQSED